MMNLILLIGTIFIVAKGGGMFQLLVFWAICGTASHVLSYYPTHQYS